MANAKPIISKHALERLVRYLAYLKALPTATGANISATAIAEALENLRRFEPIIVQSPDGSILVYYLDDEGVLHEDCIFRATSH